jgi:hypothetical protein
VLNALNKRRHVSDVNAEFPVAVGQLAHVQRVVDVLAAGRVHRHHVEPAKVLAAAAGGVVAGRYLRARNLKQESGSGEKPGGTHDPSFWREAVDDFLAEGARVDLEIYAQGLGLDVFITGFT